MFAHKRERAVDTTPKGWYPTLKQRRKTTLFLKYRMLQIGNAQTPRIAITSCDLKAYGKARQPASI